MFFGANHEGMGGCRGEKQYVGGIRGGEIEPSFGNCAEFSGRRMKTGENNEGSGRFSVVRSCALRLRRWRGRRRRKFPQASRSDAGTIEECAIVFLRDGVQVGADVRPANNSLSLAGTHDGVAVSSGRVRDGENAVRLNDFLGKQAVIRLSNTPDIKYIGLFKHKPVIRIRETTSDRYIDDVVRVVQLINTVLPYDKRITVSPVRAPHPSPAEYSSWDIYIPDGQIFVGVAPQSTWPQTEIPPRPRSGSSAWRG